MALTKALQVFGQERPVVARERIRRQYTNLEYLLAKVLAEIPLDTVFSVVFTTVLKQITGVRIGWGPLTAVFSLMTVAGASLGYAIGGWNPQGDNALALGLPLMVVLMAVGIINPSGVDKTNPPPALVRYLKLASPIKWAIEALCVGEFKGMDLHSSSSLRLPWRQRVRDLPKIGAFAMVRNGDQILDVLGLKDARLDDILKSMAILSGANLLVSWVGLAVTSRGGRRGRRWHTERRRTKKTKTATAAASRNSNSSSNGAVNDTTTTTTTTANGQKLHVPTVRSM